MLLFNLKYRKNGVTLIEIVIAFIILTLAAFGTMSLISHGGKMTRHDFRRDEAMQLLVDRMNRLSALPYSTLNSNLDTPISADFAGIEFGQVESGNNKYNVTANLSNKEITFGHLMELTFPNKDYDASKPNTWKFKERSPSSITYSDQIIKIHVQVTPVDFNNLTEKTFEAVTYVCNMEN